MSQNLFLEVSDLKAFGSGEINTHLQVLFSNSKFPSGVKKMLSYIFLSDEDSDISYIY